MNGDEGFSRTVSTAATGLESQKMRRTQNREYRRRSSVQEGYELSFALLRCLLTLDLLYFFDQRFGRLRFFWGWGWPMFLDF